MTDSALDRRDALVLIAGASTLATARPAAARGATDLPTDDPEWTARAYARIEGDISGRPVWEYVDGFIVGVANNDLPRVLTGFRQIKCSRVIDIGGGTFMHHYGAVYMFTDPVTGALLDRWTNPYNDRETQPFHYRSGPSATLITSRGLSIAGSTPDADRPPFRLNWLVLGDSAWARNNSATWFPSFLMPDAWPLESPGERMISGFLSTSRTSRSALLDRDATSVPNEIATNAQSNWLPWMLMGRTPGIIMYHVTGRKLARLDDLPRAALAAADSLYPGYVENPFAFPKTLQHTEFLRQRKPVRP